MFSGELLEKVVSERAQIVVQVMERLSGDEGEVQGSIVHVVDFSV